MVDGEGVQTKVIDLGVVSDEAPLPEPARPWPPRRAVFAAVVLVCAVLPGGAAGAGRPMFAPPVTVAVDGRVDFRLAPDGIYVSGPDRRELAAYSVDTGKRRWVTSLPPITGFGITPAGNLVLVLASTGGPLETLAVDARTGVVRWRHAGAAMWVSADGDRAVLADDAVFTDTRSDRPLMSIVDLRTGAQVATEPIHLRRAGDLTAVVEVGPGGEQLAGVRIAAPLGGSLWLEFASGERRLLPLADTTEVYLVVDDLLVAYGSSEVRAYDRTGGRLRWTLPGARAAASMSCGRWLCALIDETMVAVDPADGTVKWRSPWQFMIGLGDRTLAVRAGGPGPEGMAVVDAATGQVLRELPLWRPLPANGYRTRLPVLVPQAPGTYQVAVLDLNRLIAYRLGAFSGDTNGCQSVPGYVACRTTAGEITVWGYGD